MNLSISTLLPLLTQGERNLSLQVMPSVIINKENSCKKPIH